MSRRSSPTSCAGWSGVHGLIENANDLLIDAADGLRVINEVEQLAAMEAAACTTSSGVLSLIRGLRPGLRERDAVALLVGTARRCHAT
jgi:hypothetical protein